jgi:type I restriction-modification system DNA methylase subunit
MEEHQEKVSLLWSVADLPRRDYKQSEYGKVILPCTVLGASGLLFGVHQAIRSSKRRKVCQKT